MNRALFIGRFQPFHIGHLLDIKDILKEVDEIVIGIGSSQEKYTLENPFSYSERKEMITKTLRNNKIKNFKICQIPDLHDDKKWVDYIKKNTPKFDFVFSGNFWTLRCFKKNDLKIKKIKLINGISSTIIRNKMISGKNWQSLVPKEVADYIKKINGIGRIKKIYFKK